MNDSRKVSKEPKARDVYLSEKGNPVQRAAKQQKKKFNGQKWKDWLDEAEEDLEDLEESSSDKTDSEVLVVERRN